MKRFQGLLKDTWWMWLLLLAAGTLLMIFVEWVFVVTFPIVGFTFIYFGLIRYDENGKPRRL